MSSTVEQIKERLSITDVIGSYVTLEKAGANLKARCPFHHEKTPSFFVSPDRGSYYCFGCGAKGDIFSFVQEFEGLDFMGALKILAERAGVEITRERPEVRAEKQELFELLERASLYFESNLGAHKEVETYLADRGLNRNTIKEWRIGYAKDEWEGLKKSLEHKTTIPRMEKVGLIKPSDKKPGEYYDRFRARIMFPIADSSGRIVGFSGRIFNKDDAAKYLNSPETELFQKSHILYGLDKAKNDIRRMGYSILVEGQMDLLMCHQAGFKNTVASSGTALTEGQLSTLRRFSNKLIIAYDADSAGMSASERGWNIALKLGMEVKVARLLKGKDPADLLKENIEEWKNALRNSTHVIEFALQSVLDSTLDARKRGKEAELKVIPYVAFLDSGTEKAFYVKRISGALSVPEEIVWDEVRKAEGKISTTGGLAGEAPKEKEKTDRESVIEKKIVALIMWLRHKQSSDDFEKQFKDKVGDEKFQELIDGYGGQKDELIFEADLMYGDATEKTIALDMKELLQSYKEGQLKAELSKAMVDLVKAEENGQQDEVMRLVEVCQRLSKTLRDRDS